MAKSRCICMWLVFRGIEFARELGKQSTNAGDGILKICLAKLSKD